MAAGVEREIYWAYALLEPSLYRRAREVVVLSAALGRELQREYTGLDDKVRILPNPIEVSHMRRPPSFDRAAHRTELGLADTH